MLRPLAHGCAKGSPGTSRPAENRFRGLHPCAVQEVSELTTALALVRAGMGLSIIPECFWSHLFSGVRIQVLSDRAARWAVGAVWRRDDTNPALQRFLRLLRKEVEPASLPV